MAKISQEERREALKNRTRANAKNKDSGGGNWKRAVDFSEFSGEISFFKPKKGFNTIDILPYLVSSKHHPQKMKEGYEDYLLDVWVHSNVGAAEGTYLCLQKTYGKPCPICEEVKALKEEDAKKNEDTIKAIKAKRRCWYNVINLEEEEKGIQIWEVSHYLFEKELLEEAETAEEEIITFSDLEQGRSIKFRASADSLDGNSFFKFKAFSFLKRDPFDESVLDETIPLDACIVIPTYEEVRNAFNGIEEEDFEDEVEEEEVEEKAARPRKVKSLKRTTKKEEVEEVEEEEVEEEEVEEEEVEEVEKKAARGRRRPVKKAAGKAKRTTATPKCPSGFVFGESIDEHDECSSCAKWNDCADERDRGEE